MGNIFLQLVAQQMLHCKLRLFASRILAFYVTPANSKTVKPSEVLSSSVVRRTGNISSRIFKPDRVLQFENKAF